MSRPFTIFYVNSKIPKEILTDTIMAKSNEDAQAMATAKHVDSSILYVRGIGDSEPADIKKEPCQSEAPVMNNFLVRDSSKVNFFKQPLQMTSYWSPYLIQPES